MTDRVWETDWRDREKSAGGEAGALSKQLAARPPVRLTRVKVAKRGVDRPGYQTALVCCLQKRIARKLRPLVVKFTGKATAVSVD